jgi:hypothetical protein
LDDLQVFALAVREIVGEDQVHHTDDAVHGRSYLVAHVGEELALGDVGRLSLAGQPLRECERIFQASVQLADLLEFVLQLLVAARELFA